MRALSALEMLEVWERGLTQPPLWRLLTLLAAAGGETPDAVARLSIGVRNARLLKLREWAFGRQLAALELCPACGERLDLNFSTDDIRTANETADDEPSGALQVAGYEVHCRAINSLDLLCIAGQRDPAAARQQLLERCLVGVTRDGAPVGVTDLPEELISAVAAHLAQADPQANVQLALACPQCGHRWRADFDIGSFFWAELHAWAQRVLREVHSLATAYGWRELDILTMSPWRRQFYLNCIGG